MAKQLQCLAIAFVALLSNGKGPIMLRVETQQLDGSLVCRLEGRFTGEGAEQVRTLVTRCDSTLELVVDLTEVLFVDAVGESVLSFVKKLGGVFVAETAYSRDICERLQLSLFRKREQNSPGWGHKEGNGRPPNNPRRR